MSKTNTFETDFLELVFNNTTVSGIGSDGLRGSTTAGSLYVALFESDPTDSGTVTGECDYTGYARVAVARTSGGWTVSGDTCTNTAAVTFGECTVGSNTATHFGICKAGTASVQDLIFHGALDSSLAISVGIIPEFIIGAIEVTED
jgi:hypothetical protein